MFMTDPASLCLQKKNNKKREKDICSSVMEERGCPDILLLLKLENRMMTQMSKEDFFMPCLNKL